MTSIYPSSTSSSSSTSSASLLRISGMASGIDTDSVVKSMVSSYQTKIDKATQAKQTLQWKQEAYRNIIKGVKELQEYFDPLSDKYLLSGKSLNINTAASDDASKVSATVSSSAKAGTYKVNVSQMATQAKITGTDKNSMVKITTPITASNWEGQTLRFSDSSDNIDIKFSSTITDTNNDGTISTDELVADVNKQISSSKLNGKISASYVSDGTNEYIKFTKSTSTTDTIKLNATGSGTDIGGISELTINSGISSSSLLTNLNFSASNKINFTIKNGTTSSNVSLTVSSTSTVQNLMDAVNSATSGKVTMNVDDTTGQISFQSKSYGSTSNISIIDRSTDNNISNLGISTTSKTINTFEGTMNTTDSSTLASNSLLTNVGFESGKDISFSLTNGTTTSNVSLTVSDTSTVQNLIDQVNSATSGAVILDVDYTTGKISFRSNTGSNISYTDNSSTNNISTLSLNSSTDTAYYTDTYPGTDALVSITAPGQSAVTTTQSSNNFTLNGVTYNLVGVTGEDDDDTNITVTANSDTVVTNMKQFIEDYNTVLDTINTKLSEKKDSDYPPLTDAQKEDMSEDQITAWEAKAKVGILRNDDYLSSLMTQLRGIFSSPVYSSYTNKDSNTKISLSFGQYGTNAIGIDTSSDYTDGGKLVLQDETKLKDAIENNIEDFKKLFIGASSDSVETNKAYIGSTKYYEDGIFKRMDTILRDYVAAPSIGEDGTYTLSGSMNIFVNKQYDYSSMASGGKNTLPDQVYAQTVSISKFNTQMSDAETRYYAKFTALETAMNALNSQQSALSSMLGTS